MAYHAKGPREQPSDLVSAPFPTQAGSQKVKDKETREVETCRKGKMAERGPKMRGEEIENMRVSDNKQYK
jgi:hypothetical protein